MRKNEVLYEVAACAAIVSAVMAMAQVLKVYGFL
jgi:hypothetical protein